MSLNPPLCQFVKIDEEHMAVFRAWGCQNRIFGVITKGNYVVSFVFLEGKGLDDMLDFH